jgi:serine/threonine protein kinase
MTWNPGQRLQDGKYIVVKVIGNGGFGTTYLAINRNNKQSDKQVVIKALKIDKKEPSYGKNRQNLLNEALRLQKCIHPNIVKVYELIEEDDELGIVMEYVEGENLASGKIFSEAEAILYIHQISDALSLIHSHELLHQDVKPSNIILRKDTSQVILIDFGIARQYSLDITKNYTAQWSPFYAPPELYESNTKRGPYTDIYSLAATLYTLLTGKEPESAVSRYKHSCPLKEPKEINSQISENVNICILLGLELEPYHRPQSVEEWLSILDSSPGYPEIEYYLKKWHNNQILKRLRPDLSKNVEHKYRLRALNDLAELGQDAEGLLPELTKLLIDDDEQIYLGAQSVLIRIGSAATPYLKTLLDTHKERIISKRKIIKTLCLMENNAVEAIPEILELLEDNDDETRWYAVYTIGRFGLEVVEAIPILIRMLNDSRVGIRAYAAYGLGKIGNKANKAFSTLIEKIKDQNEHQEVRIACLEALEAIGFPIDMEIKFRTDDESEISGKDYVTAYRAEERQKKEEIQKKPGITSYFVRPMSAHTPEISHDI